MTRAIGPNVFFSPEQIVHRSVYLAGADRGQRISVAGPDSLAAMISLCRDGFDHVVCARQATCPCADGASDVLLITGFLSGSAIGELLRRTARLLRDGGVLVAQLQRRRDAGVVRAVLEGMGLRVGSTLIDLSAGCLVSLTIERADIQLRRAS